MFVPNEDLNTFRKYNLCVEDCQKPLRDSKFMLEFQLKEWQLNINECFGYCKRDNSDPVTCITYCCNEYGKILGEVEQRLYKEYDD